MCRKKGHSVGIYVDSVRYNHMSEAAANFMIQQIYYLCVRKETFHNRVVRNVNRDATVRLLNECYDAPTIIVAKQSEKERKLEEMIYVHVVVD